MQAAAQNALNETVEPSNSVTVAEAIVQPGTGNVLAMAVNKPYGTGPGETTIPVLTTAALQPGSTLQGLHADRRALAGPAAVDLVLRARLLRLADLPHRCATAAVHPLAGCSNGFSNADPAEAGDYDMTQATWQSVNTYYIQLEEKVGVQNVADMAVRMGIPASRLSSVGPNSGSLTIGAYVVSPLDMATAYATLAAHGMRCDPRGALSATTPDGKPVSLTPPPACQQVIPASVADEVTSVLEGVITNGTGYPNASLYGRPAAGKTGTTDGYTAPGSSATPRSSRRPSRPATSRRRSSPTARQRLCRAAATTRRSSVVTSRHWPGGEP